MDIPDFQSIMLPLLSLAADGKEHRYRDAVEDLANTFKLSEGERAALLPSGVDRIFSNRVGWAKTFLKKAALLDSTRRGYFTITDRGREVLRKNPERIDMKFLGQFPEYNEFRAIKNTKTPTLAKADAASEVQSPEEQLEAPQISGPPLSMSCFNS